MMGIFQLQYNLTGPLLYAYSAINQNVIQSMPACDFIDLKSGRGRNIYQCLPKPEDKWGLTGLGIMKWAFVLCTLKMVTFIFNHFIEVKISFNSPFLNVWFDDF